MIEVNADEVMRHLDYLNWLNSQNLEDILWVNDRGETLNIQDSKLEYWKYTGLSNQSFVEFMVVENTNEISSNNRC